MNLQQIEIEGLFGRFDYSIPLDFEDRVAILIGPNGCGKTTILKLIQDVQVREFNEVRRCPFERLSLFFEDKTVLNIFREEEPRKPGVEMEETLEPVILLRFEYQDEKGEKIDEWVNRNWPLEDEVSKSLERSSASAESATRWELLSSLREKKKTGAEQLRESLMKRMEEKLRGISREESSEPELERAFPTWLDRLLSIKLAYIPTDRLTDLKWLCTDSTGYTEDEMWPLQGEDGLTTEQVTAVFSAQIGREAAKVVNAFKSKTNELGHTYIARLSEALNKIDKTEESEELDYDSLSSLFDSASFGTDDAFFTYLNAFIEVANDPSELVRKLLTTYREVLRTGIIPSEDLGLDEGVAEYKGVLDETPKPTEMLAQWKGFEAEALQGKVQLTNLRLESEDPVLQSWGDDDELPSVGGNAFHWATMIMEDVHIKSETDWVCGSCPPDAHEGEKIAAGYNACPQCGKSCSEIFNYLNLGEHLKAVEKGLKPIMLAPDGSLTSFVKGPREFLKVGHDDFCNVVAYCYALLTDDSSIDLRSKIKRIDAYQIKQDMLPGIWGPLRNMAVFSESCGPDDVAEALVREISRTHLWDKLRALKPLQDLVIKLTTLKKNLENAFKDKRLKVAPGRGYYFIAGDGQELEASQLSSGERHQLVLLHYLIFHVPEDSLLLIDEPEISLHIVWKENFVQTLSEICQASKSRALVTTHSPSIVNGRWDLTVSINDSEADD